MEVGKTLTTPNVGQNTEVDSDALGVWQNGTVFTPEFTLAEGAGISGWNMGVTAPPATAPLPEPGENSISGRIFLDDNANGLDDDEPAGLATRLFLVDLETIDSPSLRVLASATDADGRYSFENVPPGRYQLRVEDIGAGNQITQANLGDDSIDSDALGIWANGTVYTGDIVLDEGGRVTGVNVGVIDTQAQNPDVPLSTVSGRIFADANGNGVDDLEAAGIATRVFLVDLDSLNARPARVLATTTEEDGTYAFEGVAPGRYQVRFESLESGTVLTQANQGQNEARDSDALGVWTDGTVYTETFTLGGGDSMTGLNLGMAARPVPPPEPQVVTFRQSFEDHRAIGGRYFDTGLVFIERDLDNNFVQPIVSANQPTGLGFTARWLATEVRGLGMAGGAPLGVTDDTSAVGTFSDGKQGYEFADTDGLVELRFDALDVSDITDVTVSLDFFAEDEGAFESVGSQRDYVIAYVETDLGRVDVLDTRGGDLNAIAGSWQPYTVDIEDTVAELEIVFQVRSTNDLESIILDNVLVEGMTLLDPPIAEPTDGLLRAAFYPLRAAQSVNDFDIVFPGIHVEPITSVDYNGGDGALFPNGPTDGIAAVIKGEFSITQPGNYGFYLSSDDGSALWIDGALVIDNDGLHQQRSVKGSIDLDAGLHDIEIRYFDYDGDAVLDLDWAGPGFVRQDLVFGPDLPTAPEGSASVSGIFFTDVDQNNVRDQLRFIREDQAIVELIQNGQTVARTLTDFTGAYAFDGIAPGDYSVAFEMRHGLIGIALPFAGDDRTIDSDVTTITPDGRKAITDSFSLSANQSLTHMDAGVQMPYAPFEPPNLSDLTLPNDPVRVLMVGNSFLAYRNLTLSQEAIADQFKAMGAANGIEIDFRYSILGGGTLRSQWERDDSLSVQDALNTGTWDLMVLAGQTTEFSSGQVEFNDYADRLTDLADANGTETLFYGLWAGDWQIDTFKNNIVATLSHDLNAQAALRTGSAYAPNGYAMDAAWEYYTAIAGDRGEFAEGLLTEDAIHPTKMSAYMIASTLYATVFGDDLPSPVDYRPDGVPWTMLF